MSDTCELPELNYQPRGDRAIVKRLPPPQAKDGEVFLPSSQQKPLNEGIVIAVGPGNRNRVTGYIDELDLKRGDHVHFFDFANTVEIEGEEYLLLRDEEIWGKRTPWK